MSTNAERPQPVAFTRTEGGNWVDWKFRRVREFPDPKTHAVLFDDGSVFDAVNGWRPGVWCPHCHAPVQPWHKRTAPPPEWNGSGQQAAPSNLNGPYSFGD